ncbi:T-complex protein gamma SU [Guillardia theta]|uniref:T-complex protein gamma SU n=1 Tax=Guillardia theta TaxID=55529 RepID=Q9XG35_GUITH|nr:T-complex protein gamma SU [Guillardia theta]CAB40401.1 T-complex protein gamma SU [Guillardia theta]|mmetsp:Transcript_3197/g.10811  ORF Transcript_3197/g.10811 Transcript_3197/m.10811 type:complete len:503 (-) Transcript_3197:1378-2886(-)
MDETFNLITTVSRILRTSYGPRSLLKMILDKNGNIILSHNGNSILREINSDHPFLKILLELSSNQEFECGDGTKEVLILTSEVISNCQILIKKTIPTWKIINSLNELFNNSISLLSHELSINLNLINSKLLNKIIRSSISTKLSKKYSKLITFLSIKSFPFQIRKRDISNYFNFIKIEKFYYGQIENSEVFDGLIICKNICHSKMRRRIINPKIILLDCPIDIKKTNNVSDIEITNSQNFEKIVESEQDYIIYLCKILVNFKPDVIISEKNINDIAIHYFFKHNISTLQRIKKTDISRLSILCGARVVSSIENIEFSDIGIINTFYINKIGDEYYSNFKNDESSIFRTLIIYGPSRESVDELESNIKKSHCILKSILTEAKFTSGGGSIEMYLSTSYSKNKNIVNKNDLVIKYLASSFQIIPKILIQNSGVDVNSIFSKLSVLHKYGKYYYGVDGIQGLVVDTRKLGLIGPLLVKTQVIKLVFELTMMYIKIDNILNFKSFN